MKIFKIGGNDEHGLSPPTLGQSSPIMPYLNRPIYKNEFNRAAKYFFLSACARCGFETVDLHPTTTDTVTTDRIEHANRMGLDALITFSYNLHDRDFSASAGTTAFYSPLSVDAKRSERLAALTAKEVGALNVMPNLGYSDLDVGILSSVHMPSCLIKAGYMSNFENAKLMLDPQWQFLCGESCAEAVCDFFDVPYLAPSQGETFPILSVGDCGCFVRLLQWRLAQQTFLSEGFDGIYGGLTERAVRRFQTENGLECSGITDRSTWKRLLTDYDFSPPLRIGSRGIYVRYLQQKLLSKLYPLDSTNGYYNESTAREVASFQSAQLLDPTGTVDHRTWLAITSLNHGRSLT